MRSAGSHILQGVTFDVPPTGVTVLLGRNGVGKTTTLKAVLGLMPPGAPVDRRGRVRRAPIARPPHPRAGPAGLGYVPEDRGVFAGLTVAENLRLAERPERRPTTTLVYELFPELASAGAAAGRHAVRRAAADGGARPGAAQPATGCC